MERESSPSKIVAPQAGGTVEDIKGDNWQTLGNSSDEAACKPKTHIVFLKVHKSASSTVMNILFRFGETRNLTFGFPFNGASQLFYPHYFAAEFVEGFVAGQASQFNILCHHMRFLPTEVRNKPPRTHKHRTLQALKPFFPKQSNPQHHVDRTCYLSLSLQYTTDFKLTLLWRWQCILQWESRLLSPFFHSFESSFSQSHLQVQRVMPSTTFYFAILRNPIHLMESSFTYYKGTSAFFHAKSLEEFLQQPSRFYKAGDSDSQYAKNLMTFDFGFNHNGEASARHVQLMLQAIKTAFNLILISEYFDESMVLLKEALCWDLDSVVSFPLNSRDGSTRAPLPDFTVEKIKNWNKLDWEIYTHFNQTFWEKIDRDIGREHMSQEVRALQKRREQLARTCLQEGESVAPQEIKDRSLLPLQYGQARILGYNLKPGLDKTTEQMCRRLITPELQYSRSLYSKQFPQKALKGHRPASMPRKHNRRTV
ncbi:PREDICTED: galactose-3-O-sulfotransferase 2-like [Gavialis gangeticus]|uniref:galactose-3-O-sulfotransferase 2-like n=1 Tax=Gavialis gangeticus TaxID=94835 RepID=UPI00092EC1D5|nr:PREDICTED: galactose-3-O-sulfotransferase 2-like [Gavialis gangeticus]